MASIIVATVGGSPQRVEANSVADARRKVGLADTYTALVNGEPANADTMLSAEDYVSFSPSVKGGK